MGHTAPISALSSLRHDLALPTYAHCLSAPHARPIPAPMMAYTKGVKIDIAIPMRGYSVRLNIANPTRTPEVSEKTIMTPLVNELILLLRLSLSSLSSLTGVESVPSLPDSCFASLLLSLLSITAWPLRRSVSTFHVTAIQSQSAAFRLGRLSASSRRSAAFPPRSSDHRNTTPTP